MWTKSIVVSASTSSNFVYRRSMPNWSPTLFSSASLRRQMAATLRRAQGLIDRNELGSKTQADHGDVESILRHVRSLALDMMIWRRAGQIREVSPQWSRCQSMRRSARPWRIAAARGLNYSNGGRQTSCRGGSSANRTSILGRNAVCLCTEDTCAGRGDAAAGASERASRPATQPPKRVLSRDGLNPGGSDWFRRALEKCIRLRTCQCGATDPEAVRACRGAAIVTASLVQASSKPTKLCQHSILQRSRPEL